MIPRLQSIYLLAVILAGAILLLLPISTISITPSGFEDSSIRTIQMNAFAKTEISGEKKVMQAEINFFLS